MVHGELNDELTTFDAMRRKSAQGIALVLQKCCLHVRTRARMHAHVHMDEHACMFMCACPCVYMYMYMCMCACMRVRMKIDACTGQRLWLAQLGQTGLACLIWAMGLCYGFGSPVLIHMHMMHVHSRMGVCVLRLRLCVIILLLLCCVLG